MREVQRSAAAAPRTRIEGAVSEIRVLMYHNIPALQDPSSSMTFAVRGSSFRRQLELLERWGYTSLTFEDLELCLSGELSLPSKPVIITFDDAYADVYEVAFPLLKEFGMKAVVFVLADRTIKSNMWDNDQGEVYPLISDAQILELKSAGFEIGSHTISHPRLVFLSEKDARQEIVRSRILLEILLNAPVHSLSYPYGIVNERVKQFAIEAGYLIACGSWSGPALFGRDLFEIRRIMVADTGNPLRFWWQLHPLYSYYRWLIWSLKRRLFRDNDTVDRNRGINGGASPEGRLPDLELLQH